LVVDLDVGAVLELLPGLLQLVRLDVADGRVNRDGLLLVNVVLRVRLALGAQAGARTAGVLAATAPGRDEGQGGHTGERICPTPPREDGHGSASFGSTRSGRTLRPRTGVCCVTRM